jgi:hypothetical protein
MNALGLVSLSVGWMAWIPVFNPGMMPGWGVALTGLGVLLMSRGEGRAGPGWLRGRWLNVDALLPVLAILSVQFAVLRWIEPVAANRHELPWLASATALLAKLAGFRTAHADGAMVYFGTEEDVVPFLMNWEKVGLVVPVSLAVGCAITCLLADLPWLSRLRRLALQWMIVAGFTLVRHLALSVGLIEFGDARGVDEHERLTWFTSLVPTLITHLPLAWMLSSIQTGMRPVAGLKPQGAAVGAGLRGLLAMISGVALVVVGAGWTEHRSGDTRPGSVIWSDHHSGTWEPSRPLLDGNGFGSDHLYNASSLVEWLRYHVPVRVHAAGPVTSELLREASVFVLKTPTRRLTAAEIALLVEWVEGGGGLLLIGDHTNLLGMGSYLNELAERFEIQFQFDGSNSYSSGYFSRFNPPALGAHPVVDGLPELRFLTSCTLRYWGDAHPVMVAHDVMSDPVDYSKPSFFGRLTVSPRNGFGLFPLAAARQYGRGRVLAFAESTTLSNFAAFQDGTSEFYLRALNHLALTRSGSPWAGRVWMGIGVLTFALGGFLARALGAHRILLMAFLIVGPGWITGQLIRKVHHRAVLDLPRSAEPVPEVGFLLGRDYAWDVPPAIGPIFVPPKLSFDALYVAPQRIGAFPRLLESGGDHGTRWKAVVVVNPGRVPPGKDQAWLRRYLESGGRVILFETTASATPHLPGWLHGTSEPELIREGGLGSVPSSVGPPTPGTPAAVPARWSEWKVQGGSVVVIGPSWQFSRAGLGNVMAEPDPAQREAYHLLLQLFGPGLDGVVRNPL